MLHVDENLYLGKQMLMVIIKRSIKDFLEVRLEILIYIYRIAYKIFKTFHLTSI